MTRQLPSDVLLAQADAMDDYQENPSRGEVIGRAFDLRESAVLNRYTSREDLDAAGYFHVQPCSCVRCTLS
jgi:hypothetical protein